MKIFKGSKSLSHIAIFSMIVSCLFMISSTETAFSHGGGLDSQGGHNCYVGSCAGTYHCHRPWGPACGGPSYSGNSSTAPKKITPKCIADLSNSLSKNNIAMIQKKLKIYGYYSGSLDGINGPNTLKALNSFEADSGIHKSTSKLIRPKTIIELDAICITSIEDTASANIPAPTVTAKPMPTASPSPSVSATPTTKASPTPSSSKSEPIPAPVVSNTVAISGLPKNGYEVLSNNLLTCSGGTYSGQVVSSEYSWLLRDSSYATTGTIIGQGAYINLTSEWFNKNSYKDLVCKFTVIGPGGAVFAQANGTIYAQSLPLAPSVSMSGFPSYNSNNQDAFLGLNIKCDGYSYLTNSNLGTFTYEWRVYDNPPYYPDANTPYTSLGSGQYLKLTSDLLNAALFKRIGCAATFSVPSGKSTSYSTTQYIDARNIVAADNSAPVISFISATPNTTLRFNDYLTLKWNASDATDLALSSFSFRVLGPNNLDQTGVVQNQVRLVSGTAKAGVYEREFRFPIKSSQYPPGDYKFYISACDSKFNCTPLTLMYTVNVSDSGGNALVTSTTLTLSSSSSGIGSMYTANVSLTNSNYSQISFNWYTSDRPEPATDSGTYRPVDFGTTNNSSTSSTLTLTETMYSAVKGKYLVVRANVQSTYGTSIGEAKVLVP